MAKKKDEAAAQVENAAEQAADTQAAVAETEEAVAAEPAAQPEKTGEKLKEAGAAVAKTDGGGTTERIEQLLIDQAKHNRKMLKSSRAHTVIMGIIAVVFAVIGIAFYTLVSSELGKIQPLIDNANSLVQTAQTDLSQVVDNVNKIDFASVNDAITGISKIDFEGINDSIQGLSKGVASFQQFAENLSKPAFGLFG